MQFAAEARNSNNSALLITLTFSPEGWIAKGAAQTGSAECIWKAPQAAAKLSCMIPEHSTQARCFWLGVDFGEGGKPEYPEKKSGWDRLKLSPHTAEVGGANVEYNANLTSKGRPAPETMSPSLFEEWLGIFFYVSHNFVTQSSVRGGLGFIWWSYRQTDSTVSSRPCLFVWSRIWAYDLLHRSHLRSS